MLITKRFFVFIICSVLFLGVIAASLRSITQVKPVIADISSLPVIIIDAGHPEASKHNTDY